MKNSKKLLSLLLFTILISSCTPQSILEENETATEDVYATEGNSSGEIDDDRDDG
jgi:hypothetical protein